MTIELTVAGDPASCTAAATEADGAARALGTAQTELDAIRGAGSSWEGPAGEGFRDATRETAGDLTELQARVTRLSGALTDFAGELTAVRAAMADARGVASAAGLSIVGDTIQPPQEPGGDLTPAQADAYNAKVKAYNEAFGIASDARTREERAHHTVEQEAQQAADADGWLTNLLQTLGFLPPDGMDPVTGASWGLGLGGLAFGSATAWMIKGKYGIFQPRNAEGLWGAVGGRGMSFWQRAGAAVGEDNWHARATKAAVRGRWATAGKWASRAGYAVTAATAGYNQWQADADDPTLATDERIGRATTMAATTTAGAWAGAEAGAWAGGAIGTAICPGVGTVIGGAVGGLVGGFVGSSAGEWVGDQLLDVGEEVGDKVGDFVSGAGDVASDVGDALTFWD